MEKLNHSVSGLTLNLFSSGFTFYLYRVLFSKLRLQNPPTLDTFKTIPLPLLSKIPALGDIFFNHAFITYFAFLLGPIIWLFLYRTRQGLVLRCLGENPKTVDIKGMNVSKYQSFALLFGGMMYGLAGAFLTLVSTGVFVPGISAGCPLRLCV